MYKTVFVTYAGADGLERSVPYTDITSVDYFKDYVILRGDDVEARYWQRQLVSVVGFKKEFTEPTD